MLADKWQSKQTACITIVLTAILEDTLVYFTQHWLPKHNSRDGCECCLIPEYMLTYDL